MEYANIKQLLSKWLPSGGGDISCHPRIGATVAGTLVSELDSRPSNVTAPGCRLSSSRASHVAHMAFYSLPALANRNR